MKFKINQRARIISAGDARPEVAHLAGIECTVIDDVSDTYHVPGTTYSVYIVDVDGDDLLRIAEYSLRPILPDSDTYTPATQSLDDILRSVRETETA